MIYVHIERELYICAFGVVDTQTSRGVVVHGQQDLCSSRASPRALVTQPKNNKIVIIENNTSCVRLMCLGHGYTHAEQRFHQYQVNGCDTWYLISTCKIYAVSIALT